MTRYASRAHAKQYNEHRQLLCDRCGRVVDPWPLRRPELCSSPEWRVCIRQLAPVFAGWEREQRRRVECRAVRAMAVLLLCLLPSLVQAEPLKIPGTLFMAAQAADLHSTHRALSSGAGVEANVIMQGTTAKRIALKAAASVPILALADRLQRQGKRRTARVLLYSALSALAGAGVPEALAELRAALAAAVAP